MPSLVCGCGADLSNGEDEWSYCPFCGQELEAEYDTEEYERVRAPKRKKKP